MKQIVGPVARHVQLAKHASTALAPSFALEPRRTAMGPALTFNRVLRIAEHAERLVMLALRVRQAFARSLSWHAQLGRLIAAKFASNWQRMWVFSA